MKIKTAVITAAGKGTRLYPATKYVPKEMFPIGNKPIIDFAIEECIDCGIEKIILVYGPNKELLLDYVKSEWQSRLSDAQIHFVQQSDGYGTAKAVESCSDLINQEPFFVIFPDEIAIKSNALKDLQHAYDRYNSTVLAFKEIDPSDCSLYGIIDLDPETDRVNDLKEKPSITQSKSALCGRFAFNYEIFEEINKIEKTNGEYYLTDAIIKQIEKEKVYAVKIDGLFDTGNRINYVLSSLKYIAATDERLKKDAMAIIQRELKGE